MVLVRNGLLKLTILPCLLCGLVGGGGVGNDWRSTLVFAGFMRTGLGGSVVMAGDASVSLAILRPFDLPTEVLRVMDIRAVPMLSLRLRRADMDFLREVCPIRGDELLTMGLLRCENDSVQGGSAVTPTGARGGLVEGAAVWGLDDIWRGCDG